MKTPDFLMRIFPRPPLNDMATSETSALVVGTKNAVGVRTDPAVAGAWPSGDGGKSFSEVPPLDGKTHNLTRQLARWRWRGRRAEDGPRVVGTEGGPAAWRRGRQDLGSDQVGTEGASV